MCRACEHDSHARMTLKGDPRPSYRDPRSLLDTDLCHAWHPYAAPQLGSPPLLVTDANGVNLSLSDGTTTYHVIDGMSSWWCKIHGYRNPAMDYALHAQIDALSHVMFGGLTHEPGIMLCQKLAELSGYDRVFLADSGSVAMEIALKLARQIQIARTENLATGDIELGPHLATAKPPSPVFATSRHPRPRSPKTPRAKTRFAALRGGYHGDTWGVMSICDPDTGMHSMYASALQPQVFLDRPPAFQASDEEVTSWCKRTRHAIASRHHELAGIVVEPILQGAGGMWMYSAKCLAYLRQLCDEFSLLLIGDEIATGFGRTGTLFATEWASIRPDIVAVGKALTGGYLTQAAVLTTQQLAEELEASSVGILMHGPTFMANPLASAAALASLEIIETGAWREQVPAISEVFQNELADLADRPLVADVRVLGAAAAVELTHPVNIALATQTALKSGVWLRPFGKVVYSLPPYITTSEEVRTIAHAIRNVVFAHEREMQ